LRTLGHGGLTDLNSTLWGHNGTISGFSTEMWYAANLDASVVICVTRSDQTMNSESSQVLSTVVKALLPEAI
jgi:D-alanyl-D-alanine carboxypeptidase